jgi:beta-glucosidase
MLRKQFFIFGAFILLFTSNVAAQQPALFRRADAPLNDRVNDLLHTLTLSEKISLLGYNSPAIDRLQIPAYNCMVLRGAVKPPYTRRR